MQRGRDFYFDTFHIQIVCTRFDASNQPKRRRLFKKAGAKLDRLGLSEVTPEEFADHIASEFSKIPDLVVVDVCAGLGGNTIAFSKLKNCKKIYAVDVDRGRLEKARFNAEEIYKIPPGLVTWVIEDFCESVKRMSIVNPAVFISPPWGGKTSNKTHFNLMGNSLLRDLTQAALHLKPRILTLYLPKSVFLSEIAELGKDLGFDDARVDILKVGEDAKATVVHFLREKLTLRMPLLLQKTAAAAVCRAGVPGILGKFLSSISFR